MLLDMSVESQKVTVGYYSDAFMFIFGLTIRVVNFKFVKLLSSLSEKIESALARNLAVRFNSVEILLL